MITDEMIGQKIAEWRALSKEIGDYWDSILNNPGAAAQYFADQTPLFRQRGALEGEIDGLLKKR